LEFLALFDQLAKLLDEVGQSAEESATDFLFLIGLVAPLGCLGRREIVSFQTRSLTERDSQEGSLLHSTL
jgi:hypothetical protein